MHAGAKGNWMPFLFLRTRRVGTCLLVSLSVVSKRWADLLAHVERLEEYSAVLETSDPHDAETGNAIQEEPVDVGSIQKELLEASDVLQRSPPLI